MKIIKNGSPAFALQTNFFRCDRCGCEFEANYGEYKQVDMVATIYTGILAECKCPFCRSIAYTYKERE